MVLNSKLLRLLRSDKVAMVAAGYLIFLALVAIFGPVLIGEAAGGLNLGNRNAPPFDSSRSPLYWLGADSLGRSILARIVVASRTTLGIALSAVVTSIQEAISRSSSFTSSLRAVRTSSTIFRARTWTAMKCSRPRWSICSVMARWTSGSTVWA